MPSAVDDTALLDDVDAVCVAQGGQPVRDHDHRAACRQPSDRRGLGAALPQLVELAAVLSPERGRELGELARRLQEAHGAKQGDVVTSHGDLHPANLFLTGDAVVAIDLDTVAAREPAYDVGYAVSHLVVTSLLAGAPPEHGVAAAARLWDAYRQGGGVATEHRGPCRQHVPWCRACTSSS